MLYLLVKEQSPSDYRIIGSPHFTLGQAKEARQKELDKIPIGGKLFNYMIFKYIA